MLDLTPCRVRSHHTTVLPVSPREALDEARRCAVARRVRLSRHARTESLPNRNLSIEDVFYALANARVCHADGPNKWKLCGPSIDDDELTIVVVFTPDLLVVTVFGR